MKMVFLVYWVIKKLNLEIKIIFFKKNIKEIKF